MPPKYFEMSKGVPIKYSGEEIREIRKKLSGPPDSDVYNEIIKSLEGDENKDV